MSREIKGYIINYKMVGGCSCQDKIKAIKVINKKTKQQYAFDVITKQKISDSAFIWSRDINYKTIKNKNGYTFVFNNKADLILSYDLISFFDFFKNEKLYKWGDMYMYPK